MAETSVIKNKFNIVFNKNKQDLHCEYSLADNDVAIKWKSKIKHLQNIPIDTVESKMEDLSNLEKHYNTFCEKYNIVPLKFTNIREQKNLNLLHEIYENNHDRISRLKNNVDLYRFHHAIHQAEQQSHNDKTEIYVSWGVKEGLLTEKYSCHEYYADKIVKNNIYLPWAELGKKPFRYWLDNEPNNATRVNDLCKPHLTLRAKFFISLIDKTPKKFPKKFEDWFKQYKKGWTKHYNIDNYSEVHNYSAPLLATANHSYDLDGAKFVRIVL